jgi:hypothetical protein
MSENMHQVIKEMFQLKLLDIMSVCLYHSDVDAHTKRVIRQLTEALSGTTGMIILNFGANSYGTIFMPIFTVMRSFFCR